MPLNAKTLEPFTEQEKSEFYHTQKNFPNNKNKKINTEKLIFTCLQAKIGKSDIENRSKLIEGGINWNFFLEIVSQNRLSYFFYDALKEIKLTQNIPEYVFEGLKTAHFYALQKSIIQHEELTDMLKALYLSGIPAIPLKGTFLSKYLYGNIAARGLSSDIDILIVKDKKSEAEKVLESIGYRFDSYPTIKKENLWQYGYIKKNKTSVDFHWDISPFSFVRKRIGDFREGTRLRKEKGLYYYEFKEEELLIYLSVHFVDSTCLVKLLHLFDIAQLIKMHEKKINWKEVVRKAENFRTSGSLYAALFLSHEILGSQVPKDILLQLQPGIWKRIFLKFLTRPTILLHKNSNQNILARKFLKPILFQILEAKTLREHLRIFFPPKDKMKGKSYVRRLLKGFKILFQSFLPRA